MAWMKIRIGILGYGNLGRGVESAIRQNPDMTLAGIFTRRDPASVTPVFDDSPVYGLDRLDEFTDRVDVMILCGGSRDDLPVQGPETAARFNIVDSFDTHARIPEYFEQVDRAARPAGHTALISTGWDPGVFSINRLFGEAILPEGETHTFWGDGVSQGHSDAVRRVEGVSDAVQYTLPSAAAVERVRNGDGAGLGTRDKHTRECFVVLEEGADPDAVREAIVTMPDYFDQYDTTVNFISAEELSQEHSGMPTAGSFCGPVSPATETAS